MHVLLATKGKIPVTYYGGTERVVYGLGKGLHEQGHKVTFLCKSGSVCEWARVYYYDDEQPLAAQIPDDVDLIHLHFETSEILHKPTLVTIHGNATDGRSFSQNAVFVSKDHAKRHHATCYVHNGLDWSLYNRPKSSKRSYFHFLGKAAWRVKNVQGAIDTIKATPKERLKVLGGTRLNLSMGFRWTWSRRVQFEGMVGGRVKDHLLAHSKGLIFPVRWHEPFGLAIAESLYFGCPVFGTPYGSLPELVGSDYGYLATDHKELAQAIQEVDHYDRSACQEYAVAAFSHQLMTERYLALYEQVLTSEPLNTDIPIAPDMGKTDKLEWT